MNHTTHFDDCGCLSKAKDDRIETLNGLNANQVKQILSLQHRLDLIESASKKFDIEFFDKIILEWKHVWMNQRQNSVEDYRNYFDRAFGIDANMRRSLAKRLSDAFHAATIDGDKDKGEKSDIS